MTDFGRPQLHKATHQDGGRDEIDATALSGRANYVDRGDPSAADFTLTDFTTDGDTHTLDLSSIVPEGAKAVLVEFGFRDNNTSSYVAITKNGNTHIKNSFIIITQVANITNHNQGIISLNQNRCIQYVATNTTFSLLDLTICGWFI